MSTVHPVTIAAVFVEALISGPREQGAAVDDLLRGAGIDPALPLDLEHRVTLTQYVSLMRRTIAALDDEGLALFSRKLRRGSFALMARSALSCSTLVAALAEFTRTLHLLQDDVAPVVVDDGRHVRIELHFRNPAVSEKALVHELLLRVLWRFASWLEGGHLRAERVELGFTRPSYADQYLKLFPTELVFEARHSAIWFSSVQMQAPVRRDAASLALYLQHSLLDILVPAIPSRISDRVRAHLQEERSRHSRWPLLGQTAHALHFSASSLQRHLAQDSTSFQEIRDHLRRDWAIYRLQTSRVSMLALAEELDFADSASFQRAFKRWTGHPPGKMRRARPADAS